MSASTFLDYCLNCERQVETTGDVYCSQQCRLADLCTSPNGSGNSTVSTSPYGPSSLPHQTSSHQHTTSTSSTTSTKRRSNPFVLSPAYDFSSHRSSIASVSSNSSSGSMPSHQMTAAPRPGSGYFAYAGTGTMLLSSSEAAKKTLSPTSSRSSIASVGDDVRNELRMYESGFDQVRDWRRRRQSVYESTWRS